MTDQSEFLSIAEAETALQRGDLFKAYDIAIAAVGQFPDSSGLHYLAVLALARSGATQFARDLYQKFGLATSDHLDMRTLGARLLKDLAFEATQDVAELLRQAAQAYSKIYEETGHYFPGINAATLYLLAGDADMSKKIARMILDGSDLQCDDKSYYAAATIAEAQLLLDRETDVIKTLVRARHLAGNDYSSLASTRKQLARILLYRGLNPQSSGLLTPITLPRTAFYCGHMVTGSPGLDLGWQKALTTRIESAIEETQTGIAFGGLACGADILFAEAFLRKGIELNIVLPIKLEDYLRHSVEPGGESWVERFENCIERATSVTSASFEDYVGDPAQFSYGSAVAMGMAHLRARHLQTDSLLLAAFDGVSEAGQAGTAADIAYWEKFGGTTRLVTFERPRGGDERQTHEMADYLRKPSRGLHSIIFADVHGFSKISESHIPHFWNVIMKRFAATIDAHGASVLYRNTWGDAIYLVVDDVSAAASIALSLHRCITADDALELELDALPQLRIAVHHGPLFEGYDLVCQRRTYYGSEVSRTARIEPVTPLGAVYATEPFAAILAMRAGADYSCDYAGRVELTKGYGTYRMYRLAQVRHSARPANLAPLEPQMANCEKH